MSSLLNVPPEAVEAWLKVKGHSHAWHVQDWIERGELKKFPRGKNHEVLY